MISPAELHQTIRSEINKWAEIYQFNVGHQIQAPYLASLANDISFELGILEAAQADVPDPSSVSSSKGDV